MSYQIGRAASFCAALLTTAGTSPGPLPPVNASEAKDVSLIQLIANGAEWHGKTVRVIGFCRLEFEGTVLYLHEADFERGIARNAVWLRLGWPVAEKYRDLSDEYVLVEAVFDAEDRGHMGMFSGSLTDVRRLERWPPRKELDRSTRLSPVQ